MKTSEKKTVLLIDDEEGTRKILTHLYQSFGMRVVTAKSAAEGLALARQSPPDLISLDLFMPVMSGWMALMEIKNDQVLRTIPLLVISGAVEDQSGLFFHPNDFVQKPVQRKELLKAVQRYLPVGHGKVLIVDDSPSDREIILRCLENKCTEMQTAENGKRALEQMQAFLPDLIFLDLMMPEMDGFTFLEKLRAHPQYNKVPVAVLTSKQLSADELELLRTRAGVILPKENGLKEFLHREVQELLPLQRG